MFRGQERLAGGGVAGVLSPAGVHVAALGGDVEVAAAAWTLPPTIELRTSTEMFGFGGMSGTKSDSATPMPPPRGAELRQMVRLMSLSSPSASWKRPPPPMAATLPEMVVFSISESPSARLKMPPPCPPSSMSPSSEIDRVARHVAQEERPADDEVVVGRVRQAAAVHGAVSLHRGVEDEERVAGRVVDAAAVELRVVARDQQPLERDAEAAVLDAAAVRAGPVVADDAVADQDLAEAVDADAAAFLAGVVLLERRRGDGHGAVLGVEAAAARGVDVRIARVDRLGGLARLGGSGMPPLFFAKIESWIVTRRSLAVQAPPPSLFDSLPRTGRG